MVISTNLKLAVLDEAKQAIVKYGSLESSIRAILTPASDAVMGSRVRTGVSSRDVSSSYALLLAGKVTPVQIAELKGEFIYKRLPKAQAALVAAGNANPSDADICDQVIADLISGQISGYTDSYLYLSK